MDFVALRASVAGAQGDPGHEAELVDLGRRIRRRVECDGAPFGFADALLLTRPGPFPERAADLAARLLEDAA